MAKPKVFISTDIGGSDPDDKQSMAHLLTHADKFDIKGFVSTPTAHGGRTSHIHEALDAYAKDYAKLDTWGDFPDPASLKSMVYQGNINVAPSAGYSSATAGSNAIIAAAKQASASDPLYILTWGALTDVAQAIHDDPSIKGNIRVLASNGWNLTQDPNAHNYVINNFAKQDGWMIDSRSTHRGIYLDSGGGTNNGYDLNNIKGHGALGDYMYNARPSGIKMGDSWSVTYLLDGADNNNPTLTTSWGGTFLKNGTGANYYTDDPSSSWYLGGYKGAKHVYTHQKTIYNDMTANFDHAKSSNPNGGSTTPPPPPPPDSTNDPVVAVDDAYKIDAGKDLWVNTKYLVMNDKGADGGLKITSVAAESQFGFNVSFDSSTGTVHYKPATGWNGVDRVDYTLKDVDGSTDTGSIVVTVGTGVATAPPPPPPPPPPPGDDDGDTGGGSGNPVIAVDDAYKVATGQDLWVNTKYLVMNDKGADGGLKITDVAAKSQFGFNVSFNSSNGTVHYDVAPGWNGTDRIDYTLKDTDGSSDTGSVVVTVGSGVSTTPPPSEPPPPPPTGGDGTGNGVIAVDDTAYKPVVGKSFYFNTKYLTWNDKGADGGLKVVALDKVSAKGVSVSWGSDGTAIYKGTSKGTDTLNYTLSDIDGSTDIGQVIFSVI